MRDILSGKYIAALLSLIATLGASPYPTEPAPATANALLTEFRQAVNAHDKSAVDALVYWGTADEWSRQMTETVLEIMERETIASIHLAPLDASSNKTATMPNGKKYGPSIPPVYRVIVDYVRTPGVTKDESSFTIGKAHDGWYIIAIAPLKQ
ncbi:MAG TPA: hypothetical protein VKT51_03940 [Candidatus Eremiobacteraceae bacterium]|nr:hypothetical protein [Candidatus Eremiobacteraceae bacterium]